MPTTGITRYLDREKNSNNKRARFSLFTPRSSVAASKGIFESKNWPDRKSERKLMDSKGKRSPRWQFKRATASSAIYQHHVKRWSQATVYRGSRFTRFERQRSALLDGEYSYVSSDWRGIWRCHSSALPLMLSISPVEFWNRSGTRTTRTSLPLIWRAQGEKLNRAQFSTPAPVLDPSRPVSLISSYCHSIRIRDVGWRPKGCSNRDAFDHLHSLVSNASSSSPTPVEWCQRFAEGHSN